ncbi:PAP_fibrillin [Rivularia sp. PCC 7116]|uniref:PAP/fibrillin family protein n=1 Tax=Rivularia sp. PCC 7116 TaxID=373994 RepID=UPI00029F24E6|nr:PAP/fibrillin family protein [Rivularia sp. PCC 7116]AFY54534.1 PAP_fibrillin [Rivularia sp. PCC 7116]
MKVENQSNDSLKTQLIQQVEALPFQQAIFPQSEPDIDRIIQNLEEINLTPHPLNFENQALISGSWQLIYASNGTVVTRQVATIPDWTGIKIKEVYQTLNFNDSGITTSNCAKIELPILGELKIEASGIWKCEEDETTALVSFDAFTFQATKPFSLPVNLPELKIPVIEALRNEAVWITSYLDEEIRVGRGKTGNLFLFRRE